MDTWLWVVIIVAIVVVALAVVIGLSMRRRRRLQRTFGSEYERTVAGSKSRRTGERDLEQRYEEHDALDIRSLSEASRTRYVERWNVLQSRFVDTPPLAVAEADGLVTEVMRECGYPVDDFDVQSRIVSVDHPEVVENYRRGHAIYVRNVEGSASTEDLRQAVTSYRALFEDLVQEPIGASPADVPHRSMS